MGTASFVAAIVLLVLYSVVWALCLNGWHASRRYAKRLVPSRFRKLDADSVPGVTIIRPLCGLDNNLYNTLESSMCFDYPKYEVIFALQSGSDEALRVVEMLMSRYPHVAARVVVNGAKVGVNPKVNNLMEPFEQAQYDLVWVIDATISLGPDVLGRMVDAFVAQPGADEENSPLVGDADRQPPSRGQVGLVHQVPIAVVYQRSWGCAIEQAYLNSTHAKMYLSINATKIDSCVVGKSNMYSRANIASLTSPSPTLRSQPDPPRGLAGFGPFMAEDNMIGLSIWHELGLKHAMTPDVALDFLGPMSVRGYIDRRARWIRVRKMMTLPATLLEPFTESLVAGVYSSWAIGRLTGWKHMWLWFVLNEVVWLLVDLDVRRRLATNAGNVPAPTTPAFILAWAAREALALPIWIYAMLGSTVVWRGNTYRVLASGECRSEAREASESKNKMSSKRGKMADSLDQDTQAARTPLARRRRNSKSPADDTGEAKRID